MDIDVNTLGLRSFVTFYSIFCAFIVLSVFLSFLCVLLLLTSVINNDDDLTMVAGSRVQSFKIFKGYGFTVGRASNFRFSY